MPLAFFFSLLNWIFLLLKNSPVLGEPLSTEISALSAPTPMGVPFMMNWRSTKEEIAVRRPRRGVPMTRKHCGTAAICLKC